jgi:hypothetical protein
MHFFLEQSCTSLFVAWLLGFMVGESSWVSFMTVKCLWNDRKPFFG